MSNSDRIEITLSRVQLSSVYYAALSAYADTDDSDPVLESALSIIEKALDRDEFTRLNMDM